MSEYDHDYTVEYCKHYDYIFATYWQRTYRVNFYLLFPVVTLEQIQHFYSHHLGLVETPTALNGDASAYDVIPNDGEHSIGSVISTTCVKRTPKWLAILSHECCHVAFDTLFGRGAEINPTYGASNEHYTYLQQEIFEVALNMLLDGTQMLTSKRKTNASRRKKSK